MLFSQTIRIEYEFFTAPFHCVVFSNLLLFSSADWLPTSENCFVWANFKSTLGRIARLQLSWGSFAFHARLTLLSLWKRKSANFWIDWGLEWWKEIYLFWKSLNSGVRVCQLIFKRCFALLTEESKWSRLGSLFSPFVLSEDRKLTRDIFHFSQNSFPSDSSPTFWWWRERKIVEVHVSTFIP